MKRDDFFSIELGLQQRPVKKDWYTGATCSGLAANRIANPEEPRIGLRYATF